MTAEKYLPIKGHNIIFDAESTAKGIIIRHMDGYLHGCHTEYDTNEAMMDDMYYECAAILTDDLMEGKLTPLQVATVRNILIEMIWNIFESYVEAEQDAEDKANISTEM